MPTLKPPVEISAPSADGNAYPLLVDFSPNRLTLPAFVKDVDGTWFGKIRIPENYVGTPKIEIDLLANATTGVVRLTVGAGVAADAESWDCAFTDETAQDITVPATAYLGKRATFPSSGNLAVTGIAAGKWLFVRIVHNGTHANDTLAVDVSIGGVAFSYADV